MKQNHTKKNILLWVFGWIFCFPIPLSIVIYRSRLSKLIKTILLSVLWFFIILGLILDATGLSKTDETTGSKEDKIQEKSRTVDDKLNDIINGISDLKKGCVLEFDKVNCVCNIRYENTKSVWDEHDLINKLLTDYVNFCVEAYKLDGVEKVNFVGATEMVDLKGNGAMTDVFSIRMNKEKFEEYNWNKMKYKKDVYDTILSDCEFLWIHPGIMKNLIVSDIYYQ